MQGDLLKRRRGNALKRGVSTEHQPRRIRRRCTAFRCPGPVRLRSVDDALPCVPGSAAPRGTRNVAGPRDGYEELSTRAVPPAAIRVPRASRARYFAAAALAFGAFALLGLFTSLAPVFVAGDLGITSRAIAGLVVFLTFGSAASMQILLRKAGALTQVGWGVGLMIVGLASITTGVFVSSFEIFVVGGILAGGAAGILFKNSLAIGSALAEPRFRGEALAGLFLFGYIGLSAPVLGIGIATLSIPLTVALFWFAIFTGLVVLAGGIALARRPVRSGSPS